MRDCASLCKATGILLKPSFHSWTLQASPSHTPPHPWTKSSLSMKGIRSTEGKILNQLIFVLII